MRAILDRIDQETNDIHTLWFKPQQPIRYDPGQFIEVTLKHSKPDERGEKRWFTLSSAPDDERGVSITTHYAGDMNSSSFKKALFSLNAGAELTVSQPMGDFVLPKDPTIPLIFVAGGIGVTPFHSMFTWLTNQKERRTIRFLYSVHNEEAIIFQDTFARAGIHATIIVQEPSETWGGEQGRLSPEQIIGLGEPTDESLFYLSGPEPMIESLSKGLRTTGMPQRRIVTDFFPGYRDI